MGNQWRRACVFLLAFALLSVTGSADAHSGAIRYVDARPTDTGATTRIRVDRSSAGLALGVGTDASVERMMERGELLRAFAMRGIEVRAGDAPCRPAERVVGIETDRV